MPRTTLVIGGGGREHVLCWKLRQSPSVGSLYCAPGNAGTAAVAENVPIGAGDIPALLDFAKRRGVDLTVVGPEAPLAGGIVDVFRDAGLPIFGPTRDAARLETSKAFAKEFMHRHRIPTAGSRTFRGDERDAAREYLRDLAFPVVLKADGLAAGKGVVVAADFGEAAATADAMLSGEAFGDAGTTLVVEEFLTGIEASVFVLCRGRHFAALAPAQDHKRILDDDRGKNTGGMGAFAPTPYVPRELLSDVKLRVVRPTLDGMAAEGIPYSGVLFLGLMLTPDGPRVLEYNCRFGDPEAQVVLPLVDEDLGDLLAEVAEGTFTRSRIRLHDANAVCVVMASSGYPDAYETGKIVSGLDAIDEPHEGVLVFHAGTTRSGSRLLTSGGRVLAVTALGQGNDFASSIRVAYNAVQRIRFDGAYYRTDIGRAALAALE